ncbi:Uncharacterised protein [Chryseobacterium gleum]|uniref:Uncharacterized protein n=2 Tax=Chryseobacterium gleum TaxID=250 RepID=A0A3S4NXG0_CHRGE|nr:hypothetical protein [Chryseobacterium gleum]EFK36856.1 hypothetical protein HMPREF0204_11413 [Chryseobacterium gleum ATCC 35910]QQY32105.1 hypothetical protein I6I60_25290 [Chryseobacterium gleum]VEE10671.1 Uncharacterised protein [Chryseobacterium gleum]
MEKLKYGQPISLRLSNYLRDFTTKEDVANVSTETGVSISTLNYVKRRANNVSEGNEKGIICLAKKALENAEAKRKEALRCKKELSLILQS